MNNIEKFEQIRDYLMETIIDTVSNFWCDHENLESIYAFPLIKEITKIIKSEIKNRTDLDESLLPQFKIKIQDEDLQISVQEYFNDDKELIFLSNVSINQTIYDLYCRKSFDPRFNYSFIAKYGSDKEQKTEGTKTAETEYMLGMPTPLSVAYEIAKEEGYIM